MATDHDVIVRRALDGELEQTVALRWRWNIVERGRESQFSEDEFVKGAAAWARAHADTHLPHVAVDPSGRIIGMAWLALAPRVASTDGFDRVSGDLQSCYVLPEHRGAGIGGRLVRAVLASAREQGAEFVTVHTSPESPAMYLRNGFEQSGQLLFAALGD